MERDRSTLGEAPERLASRRKRVDDAAVDCKVKSRGGRDV